MSIESLRVGLIVPSSNTVMEPDFHRQIGKSAIVSTTRILLEDVTREAETRMLKEDLPQAIKLIGTTASDVIVFGCTSAGALGKLSHDDAISRLIEDQTDAKAVTVLQAVLMLLGSIRPQKIAVLTPYIDDLTRSIARSLAEAGFSVIKAAGMGIKANLEIGRVTPTEILRFAESQLSGIDADCLFLSCTNWRAIETVQHLQKKLGIPVVTSNQAAIEIVEQQGKAFLAKQERL
ncbi:MAG TPA: Asp/Glu racemase [Candidatus Angelobacter sp.]|nr:Asp/Glu racemase [Candidatus Angelobacter sp.]